MQQSSAQWTWWMLPGPASHRYTASRRFYTLTHKYSAMSVQCNLATKHELCMLAWSASQPGQSKLKKIILTKLDRKCCSIIQLHLSMLFKCILPSPSPCLCLSEANNSTNSQHIWIWVAHSWTMKRNIEAPFAFLCLYSAAHTLNESCGNLDQSTTRTVTRRTWTIFALLHYL